MLGSPITIGLCGWVFPSDVIAIASGGYLISDGAAPPPDVVDVTLGDPVSIGLNGWGYPTDVIAIATGGYILTRELTSIQVVPSATRVAFNKAKQFVCAGFDQLGGSIATGDVTWSTDAVAGSINQQGLFTAGETAEECTVTATVGKITDSASISVVEKLPRLSNHNSTHTGIAVRI